MPDRPQTDYWGYPSFGDGDLDAWLAGNKATAPPAVDDVLSALRAGPAHAELTGETSALAEFGRVHKARRARRDRSVPVMWFASAAALIAMAVCGAAAAAGRLPTPIQNIAHVVFAAPSSTHVADGVSRRGPGSGAGGPELKPKVSSSGALADSAARGALIQECAAYRRDDEHGAQPGNDSRYRPLVKAAGGASHVLSFCATEFHVSGPQPGSGGSSPHSGSGSNSHPGSNSGSGSGSGSSGSTNSDPGSGSGSGTGPGSGTGSGSGSGSGGSVSSQVSDSHPAFASATSGAGDRAPSGPGSSDGTSSNATHGPASTSSTELTAHHSSTGRSPQLIRADIARAVELRAGQVRPANTSALG